MKKAGMILLLAVLTVTACKKESSEPENKPVAQPKDSVTTTPDSLIVDSVIEISTDFGKMYMWLHKQTPLHRANFFKLTSEGFFNGTTFHRIVKDFVIQGGDPNSRDTDSTNDGSGGPGYTIDAEIKDSLKHVRGAVGAARLADAVNPSRASSGSQFYICMTTASTAQLNTKYTVFGYIMKGMDVADAIVKQPNNAKNRPYTDIPMQVTIVPKTRAAIVSEFGYQPVW